MRTIYKYPLEIVDEQFIELPADAMILTAQNQNQVLCLWTILDTESPKVKRKIWIIGTGNPIPEHSLPLDFIVTVQWGMFVWHIFEVR